MAFTTNFDTSNKADFVVDLSATDAETGDDIDFTGADVAIAISATGDTSSAPLISATIANGLITQPSSTVIELSIPAAQMAALQPGTYQIDGIYELSGQTFELINGAFVVHYTAASL